MQLLRLQSAEGGDLLNGSQFRQRVESSFDERDRIIGAVGLGQNIVDASHLADRTHRLASDDAGTGTGRNQQDPGRSIATPDLVRDRPFDQWNIDHAAAGRLLSLLHAGRYFVRLAVAPAGFAFAVADGDHGGKAETPATLDHCGAALDLHNAIENAFGKVLVFRRSLFAWCVTNGSILVCLVFFFY